VHGSRGVGAARISLLLTSPRKSGRTVKRGLRAAGRAGPAPPRRPVPRPLRGAGVRGGTAPAFAPGLAAPAFRVTNGSQPSECAAATSR
jgi:hypothetical protein